jgi:hypothetical protein
MNPADFATVIVDAIARVTTPLAGRLTAVERAVGISPSTSSVKPRVRLAVGEWSADREYAANDATVYRGRLFRATTDVVGLAPDDTKHKCWEPIDRGGGA